MMTCLLCAKKLAENSQLCLEFQITYALKEKIILLKAFMQSQFGYCPITGMSYRRSTNSEINQIHGCTMSKVYKDNISSYKELVKINKFLCIHQRNIQPLVIERFKVKNNLSNKIICDAFETGNLNYNLRLQTEFVRTLVNRLVENLKSFKK